MTILVRAVEMAQRLLTDRLSTADAALDATAGNGHDTLFLAKLTPPDAEIWAFDIQASALANTHKILVENGLVDKVRLVNACHSRIAIHIRQPLDVVMYNLGYLPGGDREMTTQGSTTIASLTQVIPLLSVGGLVSIVAYPGHPSGLREHAAVRDFLTDLPPNEYIVGCWSMPNQKKDPPVLYIVQRIRGEMRENPSPREN